MQPQHTGWVETAPAPPNPSATPPPPCAAQATGGSDRLETAGLGASSLLDHSLQRALLLFPLKEWKETGHLGTRCQYLGSFGVSALLSSVREADSNISAQGQLRL